MDCKKVLSLLPAYLDGELEGSQIKRVRDHLSGCAGCARELEAFNASWELLGEWKDIAPDQGFVGKFWTRLGQEQTWFEKACSAIKEGLRERRWAPAIVAVCVFVLVGSFSFKHYMQIRQTEQALSGMTPEELEMVRNIELAENLEFIQSIDFYSDLDELQNLDGQQSS